MEATGNSGNYGYDYFRFRKWSGVDFPIVTTQSCIRSGKSLALPTP